MEISQITSVLAATWPVWLMTIVLIVAAVIDGVALKVPNWITYPLIISGWIYSVAIAVYGGQEAWYWALGWSLLGTVVGLLLLLPAYAIGGMGAGDVKLMMGIGAWFHVLHTFNAFCISAVVGAVMAVGMVLYLRAWEKHSTQAWLIFQEIMTIRDPEKLSEIAAERKPSMLLLPYGIPIAIGTIGYFFWAGLFTQPLAQ